MSNHSCTYHSPLVPSPNMKLLVIIVVTACIMVTTVNAKPLFSLKVVEVPVVVPKIDILGSLSKVLGIKAALIGHTLRAKANILHKVANIKGGLGALLTSSAPQEHVYVKPSKPVESVVVNEKPTLPPSPSPTYAAPPPSETYGAPPPSQTYGVPYPA